MYEKTLTIFNYYESPTTGDAYWYPHVLSNVDLNTDRGAIIRRYGIDSSDNSELHVSYYRAGKGAKIAADSKLLLYVPPIMWRGQTNDLLSETITFTPGADFFWEGVWDKDMVNDEDYRGGFYQYMNQRFDNVFKITSVGGPCGLIPHFEILAK